MIIFPWREKFICKHFIEQSFGQEDENIVPDFSTFETLSTGEQYYLASNFNWDEGVKILKWIIESPKCDKGTAGLIFWGAEPDFYIEHTSETIPAYEKEVFDLLQLITQRFANNDFRSSRYKFGPGSSLKHIDFARKYVDWNLSSELQYVKPGRVPISIGSIRKWVAEYQRKQFLKSRELRKNKRRK
jgi:hypothetical protein